MIIILAYLSLSQCRPYKAKGKQKQRKSEEWNDITEELIEFTMKDKVVGTKTKTRPYYRLFSSWILQIVCYF